MKEATAEEQSEEDVEAKQSNPPSTLAGSSFGAQYRWRMLHHHHVELGAPSRVLCCFFSAATFPPCIFRRLLVVDELCTVMHFRSHHFHHLHLFSPARKAIDLGHACSIETKEQGRRRRIKTCTVVVSPQNHLMSSQRLMALAFLRIAMNPSAVDAVGDRFGNPRCVVDRDWLTHLVREISPKSSYLE